MRACFIFLMAMGTLLSSSDAASAATGSDLAKLAKVAPGDIVRALDATPKDGATKRFLRSTKDDDKHDNDDVDDMDSDDEERGNFDPKVLEKALGEDHYAKQLVKRWYKSDKLTDAQVAHNLGIDLNSFGGLQHKYVDLYWKFFNYRAQKLEKLRNKASTSRK